ncbi:MFS transporter [Actinoplanes sichuanensis]|uniref:MFS transporter n=1 Tax=Actinoplanes sichuanensis TaxID=512349 RepID=A0ABW4ABT4_9ACTN|nr:MFS transporter [Actinoplanes sichuanensis]BEL05302.1 MFS transporter [Actinoplanes sichuanensis]
MTHPLRQAAFARLWAAGFFGEIGQWALMLALPLYVLQLTGSALITSAVALLGLLPSLVFAPLAGAVADRWNVVLLLVLLSAGQGLLLPALLLVDDTDDLWIVYLVSAGEAALAAMFEAAKNVAVATLVAEDQLVAANAAIALNANLGRLVGSPLGGVVLGFWGLPGVVTLGGAAFAVAAGLAATVPRHRAVGMSPPAFWRGFGDALGSMWRIRELRACVAIEALTAVAQGMFVVLFLLFITRLLGKGETEAGLLRGVQAIGGLVGGVTAGLLARRLGPARLLAAGLLAFGVVSAVTWNASSFATAFWVYIVLFVIVGVPGVYTHAGWLSILQRAAPPAIRGRVLGATLGLADGFQALGMFIAGVLAGTLSTLTLLNAQAALFLVAAVAVRLLPTPRRP